MSVFPYRVEQWCQALESDEYKQGHQKMTELFNGEAYRAIGVLCKISGLGEYRHDNGGISGWHYAVMELQPGAKNPVLRTYYSGFPVSVAKWLGIYPQMYWHQIQVKHESYGSQDVFSLELNYRLTFKQIAEVLRQNFCN